MLDMLDSLRSQGCSSMTGPELIVDTGRSRGTIYQALDRLEALGWIVKVRELSGRGIHCIPRLWLLTGAGLATLEKEEARA